ncbi:hypothetical protein B296_00059078 [Ensete ventricosum]|uniref:TF-B3 domain-containing protein n=1 Tax=Ensete ventricosum TaxID=4639 RepID=A0A426X0G3_ENSVE|nr:hypothetical protein B296_00059078 [Ensete ventricosum]
MTDTETHPSSPAHNRSRRVPSATAAGRERRAKDPSHQKLAEISQNRLVLCAPGVRWRALMLLPRRFYPFLPSACVPVTLSYGNRAWKMKYSGKGILRRLCSGWKKFAVDTDLKVGDGCVLELMDSNNILFKVQILRQGVLPVKSDKGLSPDAPISID